MSRTIEVDTKTFIRFWLVIIAFAGLGYLILKAASGLIIIFISAFLAIALKPLAKLIDKIDKRKERPQLATIIAVLVVVLGFSIILAVIGPVIISQVSVFLSTAPQKIAAVTGEIDIDKFGNYFGIPDLQLQITSAAKNFSNTLLNNISNIAITGVGTIGTIITNTILTIVLTILFMLEGPQLVEDFWRAISPRDSQATRVWHRVTSKMSTVVAKYVSVQVLIALLDGIVTASVVFILCLIFNVSGSIAVPLGLIAFLFYLIPMFGPVITCIINSILLFVNSPWAALSFFLFYVIYQQIENNVIGPRVQGKGLGLPPVIILISIIIGMYAFGLIGCLIAIPIAGCIKVIIDEYAAIRKVMDN